MNIIGVFALSQNKLHSYLNEVACCISDKCNACFFWHTLHLTCAAGALKCPTPSNRISFGNCEILRPPIWRLRGISICNKQILISLQNSKCVISFSCTTQCTYVYIGISFHSTFSNFYREVGSIVAHYVNNRIVVPTAKIYFSIRTKIKRASIRFSYFF